MRKVWDKYWGYDLFLPWINWCTRTTYTKINIVGKENIPDLDTTSVILTPNHCNTLMDALVLLYAMGGHVAYSARADIFRNPFIAKILNDLKIMPIYRQRDGEDSAMRNLNAFKEVVECLNHKTYYSIFPEGTHRPHRSLMPLKKGVFRIAEHACRENPGRPLAIVPVGLEYRDYFNIMRPVTISFGEPLYVKVGDDLKELADTLASRISSLITWFPDDENLLDNERAFEESRRPHFNLLHYIAGVLLLPLLVLFAFLCSPALLLTIFFKSKIKDHTWYNTVRYACKQVTLPFCLIGAAVAGFINLPWYLALLLVAATLYAHSCFYLILVFYKQLLRKC